MSFYLIQKSANTSQPQVQETPDLMCFDSPGKPQQTQSIPASNSTPVDHAALRDLENKLIDVKRQNEGEMIN